MPEAEFGAELEGEFLRQMGLKLQKLPWGLPFLLRIGLSHLIHFQQLRHAPEDFFHLLVEKYLLRS
jgi:hypothetical protein